MTKRWLQSADVEVTDSGAILVTSAGGGLGTAHEPGKVMSVTNTSVTLLAANADRRSATITNLSTTQMLTVRLGTPAVSGTGYPLAPAADATHPGGSVTIDGYTGAIYGIMSGADTTVGNVAVGEV